MDDDVITCEECEDAGSFKVEWIPEGCKFFSTEDGPLKQFVFIDPVDNVRISLRHPLSPAMRSLIAAVAIAGWWNVIEPFMELVCEYGGGIGATPKITEDINVAMAKIHEIQKWRDGK